MTELNKEIRKEIRKLDCDNNMKLFLEDALYYELSLHDGDSTDSIKAIGKQYKNFISKYSK